MQKRMKYLISTGVFCIIYTVAEYLLTGNINWKMVIVATVVYAVLYAAVDLFCNKFTVKR